MEIKLSCLSINERHFYIQETEYNSMEERSGLKVGKGPLAQMADSFLQTQGIQRQAYHSHSFVGNHVNKFLKASAFMF